MDTIQAVRHAREQGSKVLAIVNTYGSTIAREADAVLYTHAGPEVAVASTKAFTTQLVGKGPYSEYYGDLTITLDTASYGENFITTSVIIFVSGVPLGDFA